jgi:hypothetical protein
VLERPVLNLGDSSPIAIVGCDKKFHEAIEWIIILMSAGFKDPI